MQGKSRVLLHYLNYSLVGLEHWSLLNGFSPRLLTGYCTSQHHPLNTDTYIGDCIADLELLVQGYQGL